MAAAWTEQPISGSQSWLGDANTVSLSPDGKYALVTMNGGDGLVLLALTAEPVSVATSIAINNPSWSVFSPDGTVFYVLTFSDNCVQAYSAATCQPFGSPVTVVIDQNREVCGLAVSGGARPRVFVASRDMRCGMAGNVTIFDTSLAALGRVPVGGSPQYMVASPDGTRLYVSCRTDNTVWTLDLTSTPAGVLGQMSVGNAPVGIGVTPDGALVVVACFDDDTVWVLDAQQTPMSLIGSPVGIIGPLSVALSGYRAFVTNWTPSNPNPLTVTIIALAASRPAVIGTISIPTVLSGTYPDVAVTNAGLLLLVTASPFTVLGLQHYQVAGTPA